MTKRAALIILDGWGHGKNADVSAISQASTPFVDQLYKDYQNAELITFGREVGLPDGQMGNSEVGHLNIGAGRVVYQALAQINKEIEENTLKDNEVLKQGIDHCSSTNKRLHLMGLLSDGGVHSHINHLLAICDILKNTNIEVYIHAFLDGRDTDPNGGKKYLNTLIDHIKGTNAKIATVVGRYFAMDRDNRWERISKAYHLMINGTGEKSSDLISTISTSYDAGTSDEFMEPIQMTSDGEPIGNIKDGDSVLFFNYRTDRPREITKAITQQNFPEHDMYTKNLHFMTMTNYDESFKGMHVLIDNENIKQTLGEVLASNKLSQLRIAETEKYPHVTFFFSGGQEAPFEGEDRIMVSSPDVPTYDMQPEMSAGEITNKLITRINENAPDFICLNYANTDMVGHTGDMEAAKKSATFVDSCLAELVPIMLQKEYNILIIADHGNSDIMKNDDGSPHTAHTTNMVPIFCVTKDSSLLKKDLSDGKLGDIAPTLLDMMGVQAPKEMTGNILLK